MDYYNYGANLQPNPLYGNGNVNPLYGMQPGLNSLSQNQQPCPYGNRFTWTKGPEAAKSNPMAPDTLAFFVEEDESFVYIRKTDREGRTSSFDTYKRVNSEKPTSVAVSQSQDSNYISKDEFSQFSKNVDQSLNELKEMILGSQRYNKPQNNYKGKQVRNDAQSI